MAQKTLKEIIKQEYKKCIQDPVYFMKKYCQIQHPKKGKIPFHLYPFQEKTLLQLRDHDYNIILKSRQLGISTLAAGYSLWLMTFFSDKNILVIATTQNTAKNLVTKVKVMYENLPSWLKLDTEEDNRLSLRFVNGSQCKAVSSAGDATRSEALSLLIIDEAAFINNINDIWTSAQQTLATGGGAIVLSTPNGTGNFFHKTWVEAETNPNSKFNHIKLHWTVHPDRDQSWRDLQDELLGVKAAAQECDCLWGESRITVRDKLTNEEFDISLEELYGLELNNKMHIKRNTRFEILTPSGYQDFAGIRKLYKELIYVITLSSHTIIKCSESHIFISGGIELPANKLIIGSVIDSINGNIVIVTDISTELQNTALYDIVEVANGNIFIVDNIVSHNCDFITSGYSVVDGTILEWYRQTTVQTPVERRGFDGNLWIWEQPDYTKDYIVVADVARGDGGDYSAFHVIDVETVTQVAEYRGQISTKDYGNMLVNMATEYNDALLVIENANVGWAAVQVAIDREYKNLYYSPKDQSLSDVSQQLAKYVDLKDTSQMVAGFTTSSRTRPLLISKLDTYMRERVPVIRSARLVEELFVFIWNGSKAEAQQGYNDDLTMSFCIGLWIRDTALKLRQQGMDLNRKALDYIGKSTGAYSSNIGMRKQTGWTQNTGHNQDEDLTWLL